ncbi:uncharacterized protein LOC118420959 [Branchiostoma floridae]|uniref:Uncharacterized protein LOC118420959 n=1 Tax=Branchiostoma floridae TaxID=7739 RepID=A0A9J7LKT6_BRAFL|nr:uncharacterized protein LOC118420959 [Branchiostoma floridae]
MPTIVPTCPEGMAFEPDPVSDCMSCGLCVQFPNTGICSTQKCIDFLRKPVTEALQSSTQKWITDITPTEQTVWVPVWIVAVCLGILLVVVVGAVVWAVCLRKKKQQAEVILGNHESKTLNIFDNIASIVI